MFDLTTLNATILCSSQSYSCINGPQNLAHGVVVLEQFNS